MINPALFSSDRPDWATPADFFAAVSRAFGPFDLDVCATAANTKCRRFFSPVEDGLRRRWAPARCWCNPPYGRKIGDWIDKALRESNRGARVVCLVPARTDTQWFQDAAAQGSVIFIRGRLVFDGAPSAAPFPSALVVFPQIPRLGVIARWP